MAGYSTFGAVAKLLSPDNETGGLKSMSTLSVTTLLQNNVRYAVRGLFRENPVRSRIVSILHEHEQMSEQELQRITSRWLLRSLRAATRLSRYASLRINCSEHDVCDFVRDRVPISDKTDLLRVPLQFYPHGGRIYPWTIVGKTSGTTGTPLTVVRSVASVLWANAFKKRHWTWSGFREGMPVATLRGDLVVPVEQKIPPYWFYNRYNNHLVFSSRHLRQGCIAAIADELERFSPFILEAYPSTAYELARYLKEQSRRIPIPFVYTGSEPLYDYQRDLIRNQFEAKIMDHYGMAERVAYATECEFGNMHLNTDYSFVEIVDGEGRPTADCGYVVGTTYHNLAMPLMRYRLNDQAKWKRGRCECGRTYPMIERVIGKYEDVICASTGSPVSASLVTFVFKEMQHIDKSQVAQVAQDRWEVRIVPADGFTDADRQKLISRFRTLVDPSLKIDVVLTNDIPRTEAGKYRWVVNEYQNNRGGPGNR